MSEIHLTDDTFKKEVLDSDSLAVVDFWAPWCGPCKMLGPVIEELAKEFEGKAKICKVNTDENSKVASEYKISAIPTILFFKEGKVVHQIVGMQGKDELKSKINELL
jgi:thioredoxin